MLKLIRGLGPATIAKQLATPSKNIGKAEKLAIDILKEGKTATRTTSLRETPALPKASMRRGLEEAAVKRAAPSAPTTSSTKGLFQLPTGSEQKFFKGGVLSGVLLAAAGVGVALLPMDVDHTDPDFPERRLKGEEALDQTRLVRSIGEAALIPYSISTEETADPDFPLRKVVESTLKETKAPAIKTSETKAEEKIRKAIEKREADIAKDRAHAEKELNTAVKDIKVAQEKADRLLKQMKANSAPLTAFSPSSWGKALRASSDYTFSKRVYQDLDTAVAKGQKAVNSKELEVPAQQEIDARRVVTEGAKASSEIKNRVKEVTGEHKLRSIGIVSTITAASISAVGVIAWSVFSR
jgi:hypothetical protein